MMYGTLSELLQERGLWQIGMVDLLALPDSEDRAVQKYLQLMLDNAYTSDAAHAYDSDADGVDSGDDKDDTNAGGAVESVCAEFERLWDEGVGLLVDETIVIDLAGFWRMLVIMPVLFFEPEDSEYAVDFDSLLEVLEFGFVTSRDLPLAYSDFEEVFAAMPEELIYSFLIDLEDEAQLQCLMRLALSEEGWLYTISEPLIRVILRDSSSIVQTAMIQLFDGLDVEFTPNLMAPCDSEWVNSCECDVCYSYHPCPFAE